MVNYRNIRLKMFLIIGENYLKNPRNIGANMMLTNYLLSNNNDNSVIVSIKDEDDESVENRLKNLMKLLTLEVFALFNKDVIDINLENGDYDYIKSKKVHFLEYKKYEQDVDLINMEEVESVDLDEIQDECEQFEGVYMTDFLFKSQSRF